MYERSNFQKNLFGCGELDFPRFFCDINLFDFSNEHTKCGFVSTIINDNKKETDDVANLLASDDMTLAWHTIDLECVLRCTTM